MQMRNGLRIIAGSAALGGLIAALVALRTPVSFVSLATVRLQATEQAVDAESFRIQVRKFMYEAFRDQDSLGDIIRKERLYGYRGDQDGRSLNGLINRMRLAMRVEITEHTPSGGTLRLGFADEDPARAQRILKAQIGQMMKSSTTQPELRFELLESPALPTTTSSPNRSLQVGSGATIGILLGLLVTLLLRMLGGRWRLIPTHPLL
jgi:LPS O-antigen subunit length determinant protein (WzzB/FepE family)